MEIFVNVLVLLAMIALGVLLIHLLNSQHDDRIAAFHYADRFAAFHQARSRPTGPGTGAAPGSERGEPDAPREAAGRHRQ
ncbi:hypothetical protein AQJ43_21950 [Streptomyces avermitilis]|uniref:Secreted protein n=2 Tax=Streptomyces avermitilis TaxID=33903 RepID=Q82E31_STRAW|nr:MULTISPECIES: hypothetical protein [Streptomyces]KUN52483.1 hypothetical protein AQJ43_21950 [Streptomyces avermitilis]MYT00369.1 hypothetical protein [Streptomyces sp. SID5469]OOV31455.1 hypothetical protein SM007_00460 [Streptomyces avermitilis]BAC72497.1 putative secreted protein [Streptomyces avermitilis MA-4680 = NBRC 14893]BBJ52850.1 hypothetical protein SAVMC3_54790 [Streptomyces avermitilis]